MSPATARLLSVAATAVVAAISAAACAPSPTATDRAAATATPVPATTTGVGGQLSGGSIAGAQWEAALERAQRSVIRVRNRTCDGVATGSGFAYDGKTLITNAHVVEGAMRLTLDTVDGRSLEVVVAHTATDEDIALVQTTTTLPSSLPLAATDAVPGDLVRALGFPLGGRFRATQGRVIDIADGAEYEKTGRVLRSSVAIRPGNSGGPLINASGRVVGVVFAIDMINGQALVIPVSRLQQVVKAQLAAVKTTCPR